MESIQQSSDIYHYWWNVVNLNNGNGNASFVGLPIAATVAHLDASMNLVERKY